MMLNKENVSQMYNLANAAESGTFDESLNEVLGSFRPITRRILILSSAVDFGLLE